MKIWAKAVKIFNFRAQGVNESLRQRKWLCKEKHAIDQGDGTGTIISTEPDNETKFRDEIDNVYNELVHWKRNRFDVAKVVIRKTFISELAKLLNECSSKLPDWDICL